MNGHLVKVARTSIVRVDIAILIHTALYALLICVLDRADFLLDVLLDLCAVCLAYFTIVTVDGVEIPVGSFRAFDQLVARFTAEIRL